MVPGHTAVVDAIETDRAPYARAILEQAPRVLSLMDRERFSRTAGCMDRTYWAWKFVDFPGARFQEGLCTLSYLYATELADNPYYRQSAILEWICAGLDFWSSIQHRDGSFDEAYPFERSLAATSFSSFYVAEAVARMGADLPPDVLERTRSTLARAGGWLKRNDETHGFLSNHLAAAAAALHHIHLQTGAQEFATRSRYFVDRILARQSTEGWYDEYGGADPGYQTHGSFYLARLWQLTGDEKLASSLERSMTFLAHFVHPDGSIGGEYASRNTQTYYPAAFEIFAARHGAASWIAETMRPHTITPDAAGLRSIDIYNYFPILNNLVFAQQARDDTVAVAEPSEPSADQPVVWFPRAGIVRVRRDRYDAYVGVAKGGVVKVFDRRACALVCSDGGYIGVLASGDVASTQYLDTARTASVDSARVEVAGGFVITTTPVMDPVRFAGFRLFTLTAGRLAGAGRWLKRQLVRVLIHRTRRLDAGFRRTVSFTDTRIVITDEMSGPALARFQRLERGEVFTTIHMGSSRYFIANELAAHATGVPAAERKVDVRRSAGGIELMRTVEFE
ncbi:MAG TPA: hypothetical protein VK912_06690 [Longimicrobiales bacterium]|nr:hypothetical protein [Longimicrobiales bacterium]